MKDTKMDLFWAILATFLNAVMGIILLPIMLIKMKDIDMALWYILAAIQGFILLLDLGFGPTFARNVSYAFSGAKSLNSNSVEHDKVNGKNVELLYSLLKVSKKFYRIICLIAFLLLISIGLIYYSSVLYDHNIYLYSCYFVFSIALLINIYFSYMPTYMKGVGAINQQYKCYVISRLVYLIVGAVLLLLNVGLLGVCLALLFSGLSLRITCHFSLKKYSKTNGLLLSGVNNSEYDEKKIFKSLSGNVKKEFLITISNFITSQSLTFFCASYFGLEMEAKYGLSIQLLNLLANLSLTYFSMSQSKISAMHVDEDKSNIKTKYSKAYAFFVIGYLCGSVVIILCANPLLSLIKSNSQVLPTVPLILFSISIFIEKIIQLNCSYISTKNTLPYTWSFIITSVIMLCLYAIIPLIFPNLNIEIYAIIAIVLYLSYNFWRWQIYVNKDLKTNLIFFVGVCEWLKIFKKNNEEN